MSLENAGGVSVEVFQDGSVKVEAENCGELLGNGETLVASPGNLTGSCGKSLHCKYWKPCQEPRALVILVHGLAEHLEWYDELGRLLAAKGLFAFGHDHVGHGRSEGSRVHIDSVDEYVTDVFFHIRMMKDRFPDLPVYAVGHSMGGMITLYAALKDPDVFSGVVLMGPLIYIDPALASPFRIMVARVLSKFAPHLSIGRLDLEYVSRDPSMQERMIQDPLRWQGGVKLQWARAVLEALQDINSKLDTMKVPFLVIHGEKDKLCNVKGSQVLYERAAVKDKELKIFVDAHHHLYLEPLEIREEAMADTVDWILKRLQ